MVNKSHQFQFRLILLNTWYQQKRTKQNVQDSELSQSYGIVQFNWSFQFLQIAVLLMTIAVVFATPEPKADPKAKADPAVLAYSSPLVSAPLVSSPLVSSYVPSAVYERSYHGNFAYPYAAAPYVAAPVVGASPYVAAPYAAYTAPLLFR